MSVRSDLRESIRSLMRNPGLTWLAILLLALTSGAPIAVFAIVRAVLLEPLPLAQPERTVVIWEFDTARSSPVVEVGLGEADDWLGPGSPLQTVAVFSSVTTPVTVQRGEVRARASSSWVSATFFDVAGIRPALGRLLDATDAIGSAPRNGRRKPWLLDAGIWWRSSSGRPQCVDAA